MIFDLKVKKQALVGACFLFLTLVSCSKSELREHYFKSGSFELRYSTLAQFNNNDYFKIDNLVIIHKSDFYTVSTKLSKDTLYLPTSKYIERVVEGREFRSATSPMALLGYIQLSMLSHPSFKGNYEVNSSLELATSGILKVKSIDNDIKIFVPENYPIIVKPID